MINRKTITIDFLHPWVYDQESLLQILKICFPDRVLQEFDFVWTPRHPDYLIVSASHIISDTLFLNRLMTAARPDTVTISFSDECVAPDLNIFDYALVFDRGLMLGDRVCRIPCLHFYRNNVKGWADVTTEDPNILLTQKTRFCNFIYSNSSGHPSRAELFHKISTYKRVDSLGKYLNNTGNETSRDDKNWDDLSIAMKNPYKFSIACENATYKGYISEKLLTSFHAQTIPIYWGDPTVTEEFNPKAFINCHDYTNFDDVVERVRQVDQDDDMWCAMIQEPHRTPEQIARYECEIQSLTLFCNNIFSQDRKEAKRVGIGTMPSIYRKWFYSSAAVPYTFSQRLRCYRYFVMSKISFGKSKKRYIEKYERLRLLQSKGDL